MKIPTVGVLSNAEVAQSPRNALLLGKRELKYIWTPQVGLQAVVGGGSWQGEIKLLGTEVSNSQKRDAVMSFT